MPNEPMTKKMMDRVRSLMNKCAADLSTTCPFTAIPIVLCIIALDLVTDELLHPQLKKAYLDSPEALEKLFENTIKFIGEESQRLLHDEINSSEQTIAS